MGVDGVLTGEWEGEMNEQAVKIAQTSHPGINWYDTFQHPTTGVVIVYGVPPDSGKLIYLILVGGEEKAFWEG